MPLPNVTVYTNYGGYNTKTNENGFFELEGIPVGKYSLCFYRKEFPIKIYRGISVEASSVTDMGIVTPTEIVVPIFSNAPALELIIIFVFTIIVMKKQSKYKT